MTRRTGLPPRHLTAVSSRAADARALKKAIANSHTKQEEPEAQRHVPSFLMANPPFVADPPFVASQPAAASQPPAASQPAAASQPSVASPQVLLPRKSREELIAEEAYLRAASRGFAPGHDLEDWFAAEKMVDARLAGKAAGQLG